MIDIPTRSGKPDDGFKIGDVVVIRDWEDMAAEFGEDGGCIRCGDLSYVEDMKRYCGIITEVSEPWEGRFGSRVNQEFHLADVPHPYRFNKFMVKKVLDTKAFDVDHSK